MKFSTQLKNIHRDIVFTLIISSLLTMLYDFGWYRYTNIFMNLYLKVYTTIFLFLLLIFIISKALNIEHYKNIFGKPTTGFHSKRFFKIAIYDLIGTIFIAVLYTMLTDFTYTNVLKNITRLFLIAEYIHYIFNVNTTVIIFIKSIYEAIISSINIFY